MSEGRNLAERVYIRPKAVSKRIKRKGQKEKERKREREREKEKERERKRKRKRKRERIVKVLSKIHISQKFIRAIKTNFMFLL